MFNPFPYNQLLRNSVNLANLENNNLEKQLCCLYTFGIIIELKLIITTSTKIKIFKPHHLPFDIKN